MTNDVAKVSVFGKAVTAKDVTLLAQKAAEAAQNNPRSGGAPDGSEYMSFSGKGGRYSLGQGSKQVASDELWLLNITSFEEGWICWKGGKPVTKRVANIYSGTPIAMPDLNENGPFDSNKGEGWSQIKAFVCKSLDTDRQAYFSNNSISGVSSIAEMLLTPIAERMAQGVACWPVFCFDCEEFTSQGFKNYKPTFLIQGWLTTEQLDLIGTEGFDVEEAMEAEDGVVEQAPVTPEPKKVATTRRRP